MVSRIETMVLMGSDLPLAAVRGQIVSAIDVFVHLARLRDRSRRVVGIYEMRGIRDGEVELAPLFEFKEEQNAAGPFVRGKLERTGEPLLRTAKREAKLGRA